MELASQFLRNYKEHKQVEKQCKRDFTRKLSRAQLERKPRPTRDFNSNSFHYRATTQLQSYKKLGHYLSSSTNSSSQQLFPQTTTLSLTSLEVSLDSQTSLKASLLLSHRLHSKPTQIHIRNSLTFLPHTHQELTQVPAQNLIQEFTQTLDQFPITRVHSTLDQLSKY